MHRLPLALVAALSLLAGACATKTDVVATGKTKILEAGSTGGFTTTFHMCVAGHYHGFFNYSTNQDARSLYPVSGIIDFSLVSAGNEFVIVQSGPVLSGKPDQGDRISADIDTHVDGGTSGCYEGRFASALVHGKYYPTEASAPVDFTGSVEGTYDSGTKTFTGSWKAFLGTSTFLISQGDWNAILAPPGL